MTASSATTSFQSRLTDLSLTKTEPQRSTSSTRNQALSVQKRTQVSSLISQLGKGTSPSGNGQQVTTGVAKDGTAGASAATQKTMSSVAKAYVDQSAA